jgi:basic membrane protein A
MKRTHFWRTVGLLLAATIIFAACGGATPATQAPAATQPPAEAPTEPAAAAPTELNIAAIYETSADQPWDTTWIDTINRLKEAKPHGLTINLDATEAVAPPDAERVLRQYASTGKYGIIWAHSAYSEAVKTLMKEYPDIAWVFTGSGNDPLGGNAYWVDVYIHEPAYLCGIIAGSMTKTDTIGAVASFPYPNVNLPLNAYIAGAKSVNPNIKAKVVYIESWFDPAKAKESATAQIAAGADFVYAERFGVFDAVNEHPGVYAFGHFADQHSLAPDVVLTSSIAEWDPGTMVVIDAWWDHVTKGTPYDAPMERILFLMKDGGSDLAPYYNLESQIPQDVRDAVAKAKADILAGTLDVPANEEQVTSD